MGYTGPSFRERYDKKGKLIDPEDHFLDKLHNSMSGGPKKISNGEWKTYHYNGELEESGFYKDWEMDGKWKFYYDNGQLEVEGTYLKNKMNGKWIYYTRDGKIEEIRIYNKGKIIESK